MSDEFGLPDPAMQRVKTQMVAALRRIISERDLSEVETGALLGLSQPEVVELLNGDVREQSLGRLMTFLTALGYDVDIVSRSRATRDDRGEWIKVKVLAA